jgi:hypothetical protein
MQKNPMLASDIRKKFCLRELVSFYEQTPFKKPQRQQVPCQGSHHCLCGFAVGGSNPSFNFVNFD